LLKEANREPAALRQMRDRLERAQRAVNSIDTLTPTMTPEWINANKANKALAEALPKRRAHEQLIADRMAPRISSYEETRRGRITSQAVNAIGREFADPSINSYVSRNLNQLSNQGAGLVGASNMSWSALKERQSEIRARMGNIRGNIMNAAENLYDEQGNVNQGSIKTMAKQKVFFKVLANELVGTAAGLDQAKREGKDPQSRFSELTKAQANASGVLGTNALEEQMKNKTGLGALSPKDLKQKETEASMKLIKAMDDLRGSFGKGEKVIEEFTDKAEKAAKELEEVQEAQGMSGKGGGKYDMIRTIGGTIQEALNMAASGYQNVAINQPMQMAYNIQGTANIENEKYNMWHAALNGDMTARMSLGGWETADAFGQQQFDRQKNVHIARIAASGIGGGLGLGQAVLGGAKLATGVGEAVQNAAEETAQGVLAATSGAVSVVEQSTNWARHIDQTRTRIDATHAVMGAVKAVNYIPGQQLQKIRDYTVGQYDAAREMGGAVGEDFLNETTGLDYLQKLADEGIGLKEMNGLSRQGAREMGSMFDSSQVIDAAALENKGHGSAAENMQRMALLGASGTASPGQSLSKIIEEGMQRGLNSSKAIDLIVENTARMTEANVKLGGADSTEFLTKTILNAVDRNNPNDKLATQIAFQAYQTGEAARSNIAASYSGMLNTSRVTAALGLENDPLSGLMMTQMSTEMLGTHKGDSKEAFAAFLEERGVPRDSVESVNQRFSSPKEAIHKTMLAKSLSELELTSGLARVSGLPGELINVIEKNSNNPELLFNLAYNPKDLPKEISDVRAPLAAAVNTKGGNFGALLRDIYTLLDIETPKDNTNTIDSDAAQNKSMGYARIEKRGGLQAEAEAATAAAKVLGATGSSGSALVEALAASLKEAYKKAGKDSETKWSAAAAQTAASFGASAGMLTHSASALDKAAGALTKSAGLTDLVATSFGKMIQKLQVDITKTTDEIIKKLDIKVKQ
jgi:hypothetical protein